MHLGLDGSLQQFRVIIIHQSLYKMESTETLLRNYPDEEKGAYLGAIASIATADSTASDEEIEFLRALAEQTNLSKDQEEAVVRAANEISGSELNRCLDILKNSDLRFSLITDIISFANADGKYSPGEKADVEKIASYLQVNGEQFSLLDQFVKKTNDTVTDPQAVTQPGFLESLGLKDKFQKAGINTGGISKGLLGVLGPLLIGGLLSRGMSRRPGLLNSNRFGMRPQTSGIGSLISLLSGNRGYRGMGNLTPRLFGA